MEKTEADVSFLDEESQSRILIERGRRSAVILQDPLVHEAFAAVADRCSLAFSTSDPSDSATREMAYHLLRGAKHWKQFFEACVARGRDEAALLVSVEKRDAELQRSAAATEEDPRIGG